MNREEFEALMRGEGPEGLSAIGEIGQLGRAQREAQALAQASLDEGLYAWDTQDAWDTQGPSDTEDAPPWDIDQERQDAPLRVAASELTLPLSYGDGTWRVALGLDYDGTPIAELERGPEAAELILDDHRLLLRPGALLRLPRLATPPEQLVLLSRSAGLVLLSPLPAE